MKIRIGLIIVFLLATEWLVFAQAKYPDKYQDIRSEVLKYVPPKDRKQLLSEIKESVIKAKTYIDINLRAVEFLLYGKVEDDKKQEGILTMSQLNDGDFRTALYRLDEAIKHPTSLRSLFEVYVSLLDTKGKLQSINDISNRKTIPDPMVRDFVRLYYMFEFKYVSLLEDAVRNTILEYHTYEEWKNLEELNRRIEELKGKVREEEKEKSKKGDRKK
jgi:hypothetical protein